MKKIFSVVVLLALVALSGCHNEPQVQYKERYDNFVKLLNPEEQKELSHYRFEKAAGLFCDRLSAKKADKRAYDALRAFENIEIFSPENVFSYFGGEVYSRILYYRFLNFANEAEIRQFNSNELLAMGRGLHHRLAASGADGFDRFKRAFPKNAPLSEVDKILLLLRHTPAGINAAPQFFKMDRKGVNRFVAMRREARLAAEKAMRALGLGYEALWDTKRATARLESLPAVTRGELLSRCLASKASLQRFRLLSLVVFFRGVVDEEIDFFSSRGRLRLRHLL